jgi:hypothetical protein
MPEDVPVTVAVEDAAGVPAAAEKVIVSGAPGVNDMLLGDIVTPAAKPVICTETAELKPFEAVAVNAVVAEPPIGKLTVEGFRVRAKSAAAGGGEGEDPEPPPPQAPQRIMTEVSSADANAGRRNTRTG